MARSELQAKEKITELTEDFLILLAEKRGGTLNDCNIGELDFSNPRFDLENIDQLEVTNWKQVTTINLNHNSLERIDEILNRFVLLETLAASNNLVTSVSINFPNLLLLDLSSNFLKEIPDLRGVPRLERLVLHSNEISSRLEELLRVPALDFIDLSMNRLDMPKLQVEALSVYMKKLSKLRTLYLTDNAFTRRFTNYEAFFTKQIPQLTSINGRIIEPRDRVLAANVQLIGTDDLKEIARKAANEVAMPTLEQLQRLIHRAKADPLSSIDSIKELSRAVETIVRREDERYIIFKANTSEEGENNVRLNAAHVD
jgi:hypothetical protein